jgi:hypothetical protein
MGEGKEGFVVFKAEASFIIGYKGVFCHGHIGWVHVNEATRRDVLEEFTIGCVVEVDGLNEGRNGVDMFGVVDGWGDIVSVGDIETAWAGAVESTEAGLIEKEEMCCAGDWVECVAVEGGAAVVIEGLGGSERS